MRMLHSIAIALLLLGTLLGCNKTVEPGNEASPPPVHSDPIADRVQAMSTAQKVGQMVIVGLEGTSMKPETREMIERYHVSGFIFYKENMKTIDQTRALVDELKTANSSGGAPLWIGVDQEGGRVNRMPEEMDNEPTAGDIGKMDRIEYTEDIGRKIGGELKSLGMRYCESLCNRGCCRTVYISRLRYRPGRT